METLLGEPNWGLVFVHLAAKTAPMALSWVVRLTTALVLGSGTAAQNTAPPVLDPAPYTTWSEQSSDGLSKKAIVSVPFTNSSGDTDFVLLKRLDLVGNATQRGRAQVDPVSRNILFCFGQVVCDNMYTI